MMENGFVGLYIPKEEKKVEKPKEVKPQVEEKVEKPKKKTIKEEELFK